MPRRRYKPEEIVAKLRQVDVLVSQGQNMADAIRQIGVSEVACETSCSTERSSTPYENLRSSSRAGAVTTTLSGLMPRSATNHQHQRSLCPRSPRGRLRYVTGSADHAGAAASSQLTFDLGHSMKADHCLWGTFSSSRRQIRSTRLSLTIQPVCSSNPAILR